MLFVREDIPAKLMSTENTPMEGFDIGLNLRRKKWLLCGYYNPHRNTINSNLDSVTRSLALHLSTFENYIFIDDCNVEKDDTAISEFYNKLNLARLIKERTCYKNPE